ncbi:LOW QUALITY PROTEIN: deoxyribonuclease-1-like 2 [Dromiciops gliroides]|uniref:LOW QUALITY PROTEIN: deoxyribonuclease-1-like 2 n=1 Tax=Dromiciops gliroides TaxID=33562 RepID=UPI001CC7422C|nr:LOW QUALITY PROTEIN: deoxyribonuclease-1-like 2 [Dromiciops gliroides]
MQTDSCSRLPRFGARTMRLPGALLAPLLLLLCPPAPTSAAAASRAAQLRVGAFNIRSFGDNKVADPACGSFIAQILAEYDVTLVQEVRDPDLSAVSALLEEINSISEYNYSYVTSEPLGRDNYKEMYLFVYRTETLSVLDSYCYPDPEDVFSREPFIVKFSSPKTGGTSSTHAAHTLPFHHSGLTPVYFCTAPTAVKEFVLVPLHSAPHNAVAEIDALYDVYLHVIDKWGTDDILFLGDFNADCNYVKQHDWANIRLRTSEIFKWLIPDNTDTTVGNSDCAYDRIVVCGSRLRKCIAPNSATVNNFQESFGLDQTAALAISDHFPVEVTLKTH